MNIRFDDPNIYMLTTDSHAIIPTKRDEDGCYDLYAAFYEDEFVIQPRTTKLVSTGIKSAFSPKYRVALRERGSNTKTHLIVRAGQIDSGYRGEWFAALYNDSDKPVVIVMFVHQCDYLASRKYLEVNFDAINYEGDRV